MTEFHSETMRTARKPHRCAACQTRIAPGDVYLRWTGNVDGFQTAAYHPDCREVEARLNRREWACSGEWYPLHEYVSDSDRAILLDVPYTVYVRFPEGAR